MSKKNPKEASFDFELRLYVVQWLVLIIFVALGARFYVLQVGRHPVDEGDIFVLNGLPAGAEPECARHRVTPVLNSLAQVDAWAAHARRLHRALPAAIQVDSGMSRLGLGEAELDALAARRGPSTASGCVSS